MKSFSYLTSATYTTGDGATANVPISARSWKEAQHIAAALRDEHGGPVHVCGHELEAPSWNVEDVPAPPPSPTPRHLRSV